MKAIVVALGLAACLLLAFSYSMVVQAQTCCVSLENVSADTSGISGQFTVSNVAINTGITYNWSLIYFAPGYNGQEVASGNYIFAGNVESPGGGTFPFFCQMPSQFPGAGSYFCTLLVSVQGGSTLGSASTNSYSISG